MSLCVSEVVGGNGTSSDKPEPGPAHLTSSYFSQRPELRQLVPAANPILSPKPEWTAIQRAIVREYNRLGGLIDRLAQVAEIPISVALAVWFLESSGAVLVPGKALIRFEVHHFWSAWGHNNPSAFDLHFRFGGRAGLKGHPWECHAFRAESEGPFSLVHQGQAHEYAALRLAMQLSGAELAVRCISMGGCQLLGCDYADLGYSSAAAMYDAFQANENAHVLGFFDFCLHQPAPRVGSLAAFLRKQDFASFARYYNGGGEVEEYATKLHTTFEVARAILRYVKK
jgi:N-acetylmuramidase